VTYWVIHPQFKECFPGGLLSKPCEENEVDRENTFGHGIHDIQGFIVFHLWVPL
jgi:hypothetical protein